MNFDAVSNLRVLAIGDAIRDRYVFVKPLGKSIKESVLSVGYEREEEYRGGIWAVAADLEALCAQVDVMHSEYVMRNTRWVEGIYTRKLITEHRVQREQAAGAALDIASYDLVVVADFGHGTMSPDLIKRVTREARFLAVNAQTNSTNFGFNPVTKYPRADYVVIDKLEAQLALHDRDSRIEEIVPRLGYQKIVVTLGAEGALGYDSGNFYRAPALTQQVVDTIGAGDAFLAMSAPFAATGASIKDLVDVGNLAGAAKVGIVGHRRSVNRKDLRG